MTKLRVTAFAFSGAAGLAFLSAVYFTFFYPKTLAVLENEGGHLSATENVFAGLSHFCTNFGVYLLPVLFISAVSFLIWAAATGKKSGAEQGATANS